ncbi:MAG: DUF4974 domain-containing protein [Algicola sp.]|nr:DUF4974 domain-containing protein [Algicola sp.]
MKIKDFLTNEHFIVWMLSKDTDGAAYWEDYIKRNPADKDAFYQAQFEFKKVHFQKETLSEVEKQELFSKIMGQYASKPRKLPNYFRKKMLYPIAAGVAILLSIGVYFQLAKSGPSDVEPIIGRVGETKEIQLITGEQEYVFQGNTVLQVDEEGIKNEEGDPIQVAEDTYNTLVVPYGRQSELVLSDGSRLWVNSGSTLKFPAKFSDEHRSIYLEGEIYIDVVQDKKRPFKVQTSKFDVDVYGTSFNVNAYTDSFDDKDRVVLVEGSVAVKTKKGGRAELSPNQALLIDDGEITKETVDVSRYISWKEGYLSFNQTPMEEVLMELSRYYNLSFSGGPNMVSGQTCTGKIYLSTNVSNVLETLSTMVDSSFKVEEK